ncbi:MAG: hypothetical protein CVU88_06780 [Firmicutes bacterium HGW-Firmicutes-13]|nr:MAG: hypothetical protein CVU88_06780 [Firmicutes bacterium HGW-Firmicutes-13]
MSSNERKIEKHINFTPDDIKKYLEKFRRCVLESRYTISLNPNRKENIDFIEDYKINSKKEKEILLGIQYDDFCYAVDNDKEEYAHEVLYIFCKQHDLDHWGTVESVDIYIKINMTQTRKDDDYSIVVSLHKRNLDLKYLFR